jgi:hypothetical protein
VVDEKFDQKKKIGGNGAPSTIRKLRVAALFEQSGAIAPIDMRRFGMRAGEIIARGAGATGKSRRLPKVAGLRVVR